jgi:hypothetical protein
MNEGLFFLEFLIGVIIFFLGICGFFFLKTRNFYDNKPEAK